MQSRQHAITASRTCLPPCQAPTSPRSKPQKPKKQQQPQPQQQHPQQQRPRAVVVPAPAPPPAPPAAPLGPPPGADYAAPPSQAPPSRASQAPKPARPPNPAAALNNIYAALAGAGDDAELASAVAAAAWAQEQINSGRVGDALLRPPAAAAVTTAVPAAVPTPQPAAVPSARRPAGPRLDVDVVLAQLVAMDFDSELAQEAAHATAGDLEAAVEYCLGQTSRQELVQILNEPELLAPDAAMRQEQLSFALGALGRAQQAAFGGAGQQQEQEWQQVRACPARRVSESAGPVRLTVRLCFPLVGRRLARAPGRRQGLPRARQGAASTPSFLPHATAALLCLADSAVDQFCSRAHVSPPAPRTHLPGHQQQREPLWPVARQLARLGRRDPPPPPAYAGAPPPLAPLNIVAQS